MPLHSPNDSRYHVFPIFKPDKLKPDRPTIQGSAFWVSVGPHNYVVTANHVLDQTDGSSLYLGNGDMLLIAKADIVRTSNPPCGDYDLDPLDLAVFRLTDQQISALRAIGRQPIPITDSAHRPNPIDGLQLVFAGYPATKLRLSFSRKSMSPQLHTITSQALTESEIAGHGWDPGLHMLVTFNRSRMTTDSGVRLTAPEPYGMSGGAVLAPDRITEGTYLLGVGIYYDDQAHYLVGTPIEIAIRMLHDAFPETRPFLAGPLTRIRIR